MCVCVYIVGVYFVYVYVCVLSIYIGVVIQNMRIVLLTFLFILFEKRNL